MGKQSMGCSSDGGIFSENLKKKRNPSPREIIGTDYELKEKRTYGGKYVRTDPPTIRLSQSAGKRDFAHEVGHGVYLTRMTNEQRKEFDKLHKKEVERYKNLGPVEEMKYWNPSYRGSWEGGKVEDEYFAQVFSGWFTEKDEDYKGPENTPPEIREYMRKNFGEPRPMSFPKKLKN